MSHEPWGIKQQASSIKQQALRNWALDSGINHLFCHQSTRHGSWKHFWPDRSRSFFGARLFQILRFPDFPFRKCWIWKFWYYQSGPKSLRNCQILDWVQKTKKFESLREFLTFLKIRQGCMISYEFTIESLERQLVISLSILLQVKWLIDPFERDYKTGLPKVPHPLLLSLALTPSSTAFKPPSRGLYGQKSGKNWRTKSSFSQKLVFSVF